MDFVVLKKKLKEMGDEFDHMCCFPGRSMDAKIENDGESIQVTCCGKRYVFPSVDVVILDIPIRPLPRRWQDS